jgi:hypothetical protein
MPKAEASSAASTCPAKHADHAEANYPLEQPKPFKDKVETKPRLMPTLETRFQHSKPKTTV